jgi:hypothetical protein
VKILAGQEQLERGGLSLNFKFEPSFKIKLYLSCHLEQTLAAFFLNYSLPPGENLDIQTDTYSALEPDITRGN